MAQSPALHQWVRTVLGGLPGGSARGSALLLSVCEPDRSGFPVGVVTPPGLWERLDSCSVSSGSLHRVACARCACRGILLARHWPVDTGWWLWWVMSQRAWVSRDCGCCHHRRHCGKSCVLMWSLAVPSLSPLSAAQGHPPSILLRLCPAVDMPQVGGWPPRWSERGFVDGVVAAGRKEVS